MEEEKKKVSPAQMKAVHKYMKNHYDRVELLLPLGYKDKIKAAAGDQSINQFVKTAIDEKIKSHEKID